MVTVRGKLIAAVLLSLWFLYSPEAEAVTQLTATSGTFTGQSDVGINMAGDGFRLFAVVLAIDLVGLNPGDCSLCAPGQFYLPQLTFFQGVGILTRDGVDERFSGPLGGGVSPGGLMLPPIGPAFTVNVPFYGGLYIPSLDVSVVGTGIVPITFTPYSTTGVWQRSGPPWTLGNVYGVPEPSVSWLLFGGLPMLGGVGWLVRRSRETRTCMTARDPAVLTNSQ